MNPTRTPSTVHNSTPPTSRSVPAGVFYAQIKLPPATAQIEITELSAPVTFHKNLTISGTLPKRYFHTAVTRSTGDVIVYGGWDNEKKTFADIQQLSTKTWSWQQIAPGSTAAPLGRYAHAAIIYGDSMYIFGGSDAQGRCLDDLWEFRFKESKWDEVQTKGTKPPPRKGHTGVLYSNCLYIFGGRSDAGQTLNDAYYFNFKTGEWKAMTFSGAIPGPRCYHSAVVLRNSMYVFGGSSESSALASDVVIYELNLDLGKWSTVDMPATVQPPTLQGHSSFVVFNSIFFVGRNHRATPKTNHICQYDTKQNTWNSVTVVDQEAIWYFHALSLRGDVAFLVGGVDDHIVGNSNVSAIMLNLGASENPAMVDGVEPQLNGYDNLQGDLVDEEELRLKDVPKSEWEGLVMKRQPELLEFRERLRSVNQTLPSYSRNYYLSKTQTVKDNKEEEVVTTQYPAKTENKNAISHQLLLQLIMEHLSMENYNNTVNSIKDESNVPYYSYSEEGRKESRLMTLLRMARRRIPKNLSLFDPSLASIMKEQQQSSLEKDVEEELEVVDHLPGREGIDGELDLNIWDEPADNPTNIIRDDNGPILAASLNKLIENLIPITASSSNTIAAPDPRFISAFMITYQSFTTPEHFFRKLVQRFTVPPTAIQALSLNESQVEALQKRICDLIRFWLEKYPGDFNERLLSSLNSWIDLELSRAGYSDRVKLLRGSINKHITKKNQVSEEEKKNRFAKAPPEPKVPVHIFSKKVQFLDLDEEEVARQLTITEFNIFSSIQSYEFLNRSWRETHKKNKSPGIKKSQARFERIKNWVAFSVISPDTRRKRVSFLEKFIKIALHLRAINNFQVLFAVLMAINSPPVLRLSQTWTELSPRSKESYQELLGMINGMKRYREALSNCKYSVVPYLDIVLKDIIDLEDREFDMLRDSNMIHWWKKTQLYTIISDALNHQRYPYNLQPVLQIIQLLEDFPPMVDAEELMRLSIEREK